MMDAQIDPTTRDLTGTRITTLANAVYLRLMVPLGSWFAAPALGSRLHELQREKDVPRIAVLARQYAEQALQPLIDDGRGRDLQVTSQQAGDGRLWLHIELIDASGQRQTFEHPVRVM